jgi:hypothetical protein
VRALSHRERVAEGRVRDLLERQIPHPPFGHLLPGGEGPRDRYFPSFAPASFATAPNVDCAAFNPNLKSLSEYVAYRSVG